MNAPAVVAVAYSGGRDSTALLHAAAVAAREQGVHVAALHVHHGLSLHADAWLAHCEAQCRRWAKRGLPVSLHTEHLHLKPKRGESVEALARTARYAALRRLAAETGSSMVMLAHHRRDQAETFLLQALRGAGVAGLSGMPAVVERAGITWARPWLSQPREFIERYVRRHRLRYIEDDSNADPRFARNRLRLQLWPALSAAFAHAESTLADAAMWAQEAAACVAELAELDLAALLHEGQLDLKAWLALPPHRARNALRHWVRGVAGEALTAVELTRLCAELPGSGPAQWGLKAGVLRRYRGRISFEAAAALISAVAAEHEPSLRITRAGRYALPGWSGTLVVRRVREGGIPLERLGEVHLMARAGGEQFQAGPGRPPRSLKKQYQAAAVPAWAREGPLIYLGSELAFVPGLGVDARVWAAAGTPQASVAWEPHGTGVRQKRT